MKRVIIFLLTLGLIVVLAACGNPLRNHPWTERELDFMSILDTETGIVFSLGDYIDDIEEILGSPVRVRYSSIIGTNSARYENGISVVYSNNRVTELRAVNIFLSPNFDGSNRNSLARMDVRRFEVLGHSKWMTKDQISAIFEPDEILAEWFESIGIRGGYFFSRFFDEYGNPTSREYASFISYIQWEDSFDWVDLSFTIRSVW